MSEDKDPTSDRGLPAPEPGHSAGSAEGKPESHATNGAAHSHDDLIAKLKRGLAETRLPAELREQILAKMPPPEEQERLYRELQENGGLSSEQFFASLGLEVESHL
jgi:hypothetical protein